jgi:hypothetical protein
VLGFPYLTRRITDPLHPKLRARHGTPAKGFLDIFGSPLRFAVMIGTVSVSFAVLIK